MNTGLVRLIPVGIGFLVIAFIAARGCQRGPFGRTQVVTLSPQQELRLGAQAYQQVLSKERGNVLTSDDSATKAVREVGGRLARAADDPAIRNRLGVRGDLKFEWEFSVVRSSQVNAFCLPGGKVVVYTGILPVCRTHAGLAVVMGHEIGHALARHGAERMAQQQMVDVGRLAVASSLGSLDPRKQMMVLGMLGVGAQVGILLPFSREHESEADHIGVILMAAAGYDPAEAPRFWLRMESASKGGGPEFLSTHPSHGRRMQDLERWAADDARQLYDNSPHAPDADRPLPGPGQRPPAPYSPPPDPRKDKRPVRKDDYGEVK
jgi:predicted Zn-dependent protease